MKTYNPDKWTILKILNEEDGKWYYRILGGWIGGYLDGDSWRLNSGVESYEFSEDNSTVFFKGGSGSIYECRKSAEGMTGLMLQVFGQWAEHYGAEVVTRVSLEEFIRDFSNE